MINIQKAFANSSKKAELFLSPIYIDYAEEKIPKELDHWWGGLGEVKRCLSGDWTQSGIPTPSALNKECVKREGRGFILHYCHCQLLAKCKRDFLSGQYRLYFSPDARYVQDADCYMRNWQTPQSGIDALVSNYPAGIKTRRYTTYYSEKAKIFLFVEISVSDQYAHSVFCTYVAQRKQCEQEAIAFKKIIEEKQSSVLCDIFSTMKGWSCIRDVHKAMLRIEADKVYEDFWEGSAPAILYSKYGLKNLSSISQRYGLAMYLAEQFSLYFGDEVAVRSYLAPHDVTPEKVDVFIHIEKKRPVEPVPTKNWDE